MKRPYASGLRAWAGPETAGAVTALLLLIGPVVTAGAAASPPPAATLCSEGRAGLYPCRNIDLMAALPLADMGGGQGRDIWGWTDASTGKEYAIMGRATGTSFVDISDPVTPRYLGNLPLHGAASSTHYDVKVYQDHAFIVTEATKSGMQVFDLTGLRTVTAPPATFSETAYYAGFSWAHNIVINEDSGFAYAVGTDTCDGGLHMIDIRTPTTPTKAGCFSTAGYTHDAQCVNYAGPDADYANKEICFNATPDRAATQDALTIVDVTDKTKPVQISHTGYQDAGYAHQGWLTEDQTYFLLGDEFDEIEGRTGGKTRTHLWNVSDLDAPTRIGVYDAATAAMDHNLYVKGSYTYQSNYRAGLRILDTTDIAQGKLKEVAFFDVDPDSDAATIGGTWSNYPFFGSGIVIVSTFERGLFILRPNLGGPDGPILSITAGAAVVTEGAAVAFTVVLSSPVPDGGMTVNVEVTDAASSDFVAANHEGAQTVTLAAGQTRATLSVPTTNDATDEPNGTVTATLSPGTGYTVDRFRASATVTVNDNDTTTPTTPTGTTGTGGGGGGSGGGGGGTRTPTDRHGNTPEDATSLNRRRYTTGVIQRTITAHLQSRRDVDYFSVELPYPGILTAHTTGADTTGRLYQAQDEDDPRLVTEDTDSGRGANFALGTAVEAGSYYLAVLAGRGSGEYRLRVYYTPAFVDNPGPDSPQSGVSVLSGWVCDADSVKIELVPESGEPQTFVPATGTSRPDTAVACGPRTTDTGYGLLYNWNRLGDGQHTVRVIMDDVVLAEREITVTTLGEHPEQEFRRGLSHTTEIADFPDMGETTTLRWQTARQNFMIASGTGGGGGAQLTPEQAWLGNPAPGSFQSGVGVLSGWVCEAERVELEIETATGAMFTGEAGYGTERLDTAGRCEDTDNGFGLLFNWNRLGDGQHTVRAYADGEEFAHSTFTVTTLGEEIAENLARTHDIEDFPAEGQTTTVEWQEGQQNFVITGVE